MSNREHKAAGWRYYDQAERVTKELSQMHAKAFSSVRIVPFTMPWIMAWRGSRLYLRRQKLYRFAREAFVLAQQQQGTNLDDKDLVALAESRMKVLDLIHFHLSPPRKVSVFRKIVEDARQDLEAAIELNPENKEAYSLLAQAYLHFEPRDPDRGREVCRRFEHAFPDDHEPHLCYGHLYRLIGDEETARHHDNMAKELGSPGFAEWNASRSLIEEGKIDEAIEHLEKALGAELPQDISEREQRNLEFLSRAKDAIATARSKVEQHPDDATAVKELASAYEQVGAIKAATQWYERAIKLVPDDHHAMLELGQLRQLSGDHEEAIRLYKEIVQNAEDYLVAPLCSNIAQCHMRMKNWEEAISWYKRAIAEAHPFSFGHFDTISEYHAIHECYYELGNEELAEEYFVKCMKQYKRQHRLFRRLWRTLRRTVMQLLYGLRASKSPAELS
jgi:tetratricopeptide (TPR) repeat protein